MRSPARTRWARQPRVFAPLRQRLAQLHDKRRRDAEEAIRLKAEAEKRARLDEIAQHLGSARKAIGQQRFDEALETLRQASALDQTPLAYRSSFRGPKLARRRSKPRLKSVRRSTTI